MKFYYNGKTYDTDMHLYVVGNTYLNWYPIYKDYHSHHNGSLRCKKGTISCIYVDYNSGQSFVSGFDIYIPSQMTTLDSRKVVFAESPIKARQLYEELQKGELHDNK